MKQKDLTPTPFFAELERAKSEVQKDAAAGGLAFIDMTVSSPLRVGLPFDVTPAVDAVKQEFNLWDVNPAGTLKAREAVSEYYRSRGGNFTPEQILLTASTSEAYSILFKAFCNPGDAILTPVPGYPLLDTLAELENLEEEYAGRIGADGYAADAMGAVRVAERLEKEGSAALEAGGEA